MWWIFGLIVFIWVIGYIYVIRYFYIFNSKPYVSDFLERTYKEVPSTLNPPEISMLLYKKVGMETLVASILVLIKKEVIFVSRQAGDYVLTYNSLKNVSLSQKYVISILFDIIGEGETVTLHKIKHACDSSRGATNMLLEYESFKKGAYRDVRYRFYEEKRGYKLMIYYGYIGWLLFALNIILGIHLLPVYLLILPLLFLRIYFFGIYKRTKKSNTEYFKWLGFKHYLMHQKNLAIEQKDSYYIYGTLFDCLETLTYTYKDPDAFALQLQRSIFHCTRKAILTGNRRIHFKWNTK